MSITARFVWINRFSLTLRNRLMPDLLPTISRQQASYFVGMLREWLPLESRTWNWILNSTNPPLKYVLFWRLCLYLFHSISANCACKCGIFSSSCMREWHIQDDVGCVSCNINWCDVFDIASTIEKMYFTTKKFIAIFGFSNYVGTIFYSRNYEYFNWSVFKITWYINHKT